jgi:hypothetical protein
MAEDLLNFEMKELQLQEQEADDGDLMDVDQKFEALNINSHTIHAPAFPPPPSTIPALNSSQSAQDFGNLEDVMAPLTFGFEAKYFGLRKLIGFF